MNIFAQNVVQTSSSQSTAGGEASSTNYRIVATTGQSTPPGMAASSSYNGFSGFIPTLIGGVDLAPPDIYHIQITIFTVGQDITINTNASDDSGVRYFRMEYRRTGDIAGLATIDLLSNPATIPASANTARGLEYAIFAEDSAGNSLRLPDGVRFYAIQAMFGDGYIEQPSSQHSGSTAADYRIVSVPFDLDNKRPSAVFEDDLGGFNDENWKLFDVQNGALRDYNTIRNLNVVNPGKGFLLITDLPNIQIDVGSGHSTTISDHAQIPLTSGWNLIGNPFTFDVPVGNLSVSNGSIQIWYHDNSGWNTSITHLRRWEGLAINASEGATLTIGSGTSGDISIITPEDLINEDWGVQIKAEGSESRDLCNYIGVNSNEEDSFNMLWPEPPVLGEAISLRIKPDDNVLQKRASLSNLSAYIQVNNEDGHYWDFELVGNKADEKVKIDFEYFGNIQPEFNKYIVDMDLKVAYNMDDLGSGLDVKIGNSKQRNYRILIGTEEYIESNSSGVNVIPEGIELWQNFPNPFNPSTTVVFTLDKSIEVNLEIYNVLGQRVRSLINNKSMEKGYHPILWNGKNDQGSTVASGIYFIRLVAGTQVKMRKAIFTK